MSADIQKLVTELVLRDNMSGALNRTSGNVNRFSSQVQQGVGSAVTNLTRLGVVAAGVLSVNVVAGIRSLQELEEVTAATNAVIASTGGVAGVTADQIRNLAEKYEGLNATIDDKVIQSAENLLLTFPAITEDAFEPALEAALNLNEALGGGEEGLQGVIIQVGKALQDPTRGLLALRRSGVSFTEQQEEQIEALVEANDLFGAQTIILGELQRQFGGQFAAAGDTATGKFARFRDVIEDLQMTLASALLPAIERVTVKLTDLLSDPAVTADIASIGANLADAFDSAVEIAGNLPWQQIGDAFRLMGTGSKALLDAFTGLPAWVQTAVLTGWGLNKLTGGALTGLAGTAISIVFQRGSSPANPLWVQSVGGIGGAPAPGGPGGGPLALLGAAGFAAAIGVALRQIADEDLLGQLLGIQPTNRPDLVPGSKAGLDKPATDKRLEALRAEQAIANSAALQGMQANQTLAREGMTKVTSATRQASQEQRSELTRIAQAVNTASQRRSSEAAIANSIAFVQRDKLSAIERKKTTFTANVNVTANIVARDAQWFLDTYQSVKGIIG